MMDGQIDWAALPTIGAFLDVKDYDELIRDLLTIRTHMKKGQANA